MDTNMILTGTRVFYVEDNIANLYIAMTILEHSGAVVQFERWGVNTISRLRHAMPVDIVLMDLMLPNRASGYDILSEIRRYREFDAVPVVAISAADPGVEIPKTKQAGFSGFISKPVSMHDLPHQLVAVMQGEPVWHAGQ